MNEQQYKDDNHTISKLMPLIRRATFQINDKAKSFGNTLCVIHVDSYYCHVRDTSDISLFPEEEKGGTEDIATTNITTTNYEQHIQSKSFSKKKHHKKSCSIQ